MEHAWAGGFFDGEGCVGVYLQRNKHARDSYQLFLVVDGVDPAPIVRFRDALDIEAPIRQYASTREKARDHVKLSVSGHEAQRVAELLLPYTTGSKHEQLKLALEFPLGQPGVRLSDEDRDKRAELCSRMKELKWQTH
jgi:hypothetical protein